MDTAPTTFTFASRIITCRSRLFDHAYCLHVLCVRIHLSIAHHSDSWRALGDHMNCSELLLRRQGRYDLLFAFGSPPQSCSQIPHTAILIVLMLMFCGRPFFTINSQANTANPVLSPRVARDHTGTQPMHLNLIPVYQKSCIQAPVIDLYLHFLLTVLCFAVGYKSAVIISV